MGQSLTTPLQASPRFSTKSMPWDWNPFLVGGAASRPDSIPGLDDGFSASLQALITDAPPEIQNSLRITSGYRSPETQERLWNAAVKKYGSPAAARKWVAPPGNSQHNKRRAVDFRYLDDAAREYVHANARKYGLHFPLKHEPWHVEPIGSRGKPQNDIYSGQGNRSFSGVPKMDPGVPTAAPGALRFPSSEPDDDKSIWDALFDDDDGISPVEAMALMEASQQQPPPPQRRGGGERIPAPPHPSADSYIQSLMALLNVQR